MACCRCCCGGADCTEGQEGKCCCGGAEGACCQPGEYCCSGVCEPEPCSSPGSCCYCAGPTQDFFVWVYTTPPVQWFQTFAESAQAEAWAAAIDAWIAGLVAALEANGCACVTVGTTLIITVICNETAASPNDPEPDDICWLVKPAELVFRYCGDVDYNSPIYEWDPQDFLGYPGARLGGPLPAAQTFYACTGAALTCEDNIDSAACDDLCGTHRADESCSSLECEENPLP